MWVLLHVCILHAWLRACLSHPLFASGDSFFFSSQQNGGRKKKLKEKTRKKKSPFNLKFASCKSPSFHDSRRILDPLARPCSTTSNHCAGSPPARSSNRQRRSARCTTIHRLPIYLSIQSPPERRALIDSHLVRPRLVFLFCAHTSLSANPVGAVIPSIPAPVSLEWSAIQLRCISFISSEPLSAVDHCCLSVFTGDRPA